MLSLIDGKNATVDVAQVISLAASSRQQTLWDGE